MVQAMVVQHRRTSDRQTWRANLDRFAGTDAGMAGGPALTIRPMDSHTNLCTLALMHRCRQLPDVGGVGFMRANVKPRSIAVRTVRPSEHYPSTTGARGNNQAENCINCIARNSATRTLCSLLSIENHFGKLAFYH